MSTRLKTGGRLINRAQPLEFSFNGTMHHGFAGDTLASALIGAGIGSTHYYMDKYARKKAEKAEA